MRCVEQLTTGTTHSSHATSHHSLSNKNRNDSSLESPYATVLVHAFVRRLRFQTKKRQTAEKQKQRLRSPPSRQKRLLCTVQQCRDLFSHENATTGEKKHPKNRENEIRGLMYRLDTLSEPLPHDATFYKLNARGKCQRPTNFTQPATSEHIHVPVNQTG